MLPHMDSAVNNRARVRPEGRPLLVSVSGAAALLGVSRTTMYRLMRRGLPFKQVGHRRLFRTRDLEAFAAAPEDVQVPR